MKRWLRWYGARAHLVATEAVVFLRHGDERRFTQRICEHEWEYALDVCGLCGMTRMHFVSVKIVAAFEAYNKVFRTMRFTLERATERLREMGIA